jgi:hypothetical protein
LQAEWRAHPPVHWLIAGALKYRPPAGAVEPDARHASIAQMKAAFPAGRL